MRFSEVASWLTTQIRSDWMNKGVSPVDARGWIRLNVDYLLSKQLESLGFAAKDFLTMNRSEDVGNLIQFALECESKEHFSYLIENFDETERGLINDSKITFTQLLQWAPISDISVQELIQLITHDIRSTELRELRLIEGATLSDLFDLMEVGLSFGESLEWIRRQLSVDEVSILRSDLSPENFDLLIGFGLSKEDIISQSKRDFSNEEITYFLKTMHQINDQLNCLSLGIEAEELIAWWYVSRGIPDSIKIWREAGIKLSEIDEAQRLGKRKIQLLDSKVWASNGLSIKEGLKLTAQGHSSYWMRRPSAVESKPLPPRRNDVRIGFSRSATNLPKLRTLFDGDLDEFQSKALFVAHRITKMPSVGTEFNDVERGVRIRLDSVSDFVSITVFLGSESFNVKFDPENFDSLVSVKTAEMKTAYVLAIGWFIDCAITLRTSNRKLSKNFQSDRNSHEVNLKQRVRYVPTPQFRDSVREVKAGNGVSPVIHQVSGHIRRLPEGRSPREESIRRAPRFLRLKMSDQDTFVMGHTRGSEKEVDEFIVRLSQYSLTAHAFAKTLEYA